MPVDRTPRRPVLATPALCRARVCSLLSSTTRTHARTQHERPGRPERHGHQQHCLERSSWARHDARMLTDTVPAAPSPSSPPIDALDTPLAPLEPLAPLPNRGPPSFAPNDED